MARIGYFRVYGEDEEPAQMQALREAGVDRIFEDCGVGPGAVLKPAYIEALRSARPGDEIVVWRLDRMASTYGTLLVELRALEQMGLGFRALSEGIACDVGGSFYRHVEALQVFGSDAGASRRLNAMVVPVAIVAQHKSRGRPPVIAADAWDQQMELRARDGGWTVAAAAAALGVTQQAVYKRLRRAGITLLCEAREDVAMSQTGSRVSCPPTRRSSRRQRSR